MGLSHWGWCCDGTTAPATPARSTHQGNCRQDCERDLPHIRFQESARSECELDRVDYMAELGVSNSIKVGSARAARLPLPRVQQLGAPRADPLLPPVDLIRIHEVAVSTSWVMWPAVSKPRRAAVASSRCRHAVHARTVRRFSTATTTVIAQRGALLCVSKRKPDVLQAGLPDAPMSQARCTA